VPVVSITSVVYKAVDTANGDGATVNFTLAGEPTTGTLAVYLDGVLKTVTTHYTVSGQVVTFLAAPSSTSHVVFRYDVSLLVGDDYTERLHVGRLHGAWSSGLQYEVVYTAGLSASRTALQSAYPEIAQAVLLTVAYLYEHPIDMVDSQNDGLFTRSYKLPSTAAALLMRHKWDML